MTVNEKLEKMSTVFADGADEDSSDSYSSYFSTTLHGRFGFISYLTLKHSSSSKGKRTRVHEVPSLSISIHLWPICMSKF